jgi:hypothetical protein
MTTRISSELVQELLRYVLIKGGGISSEKFLEYVAKYSDEPKEVINHLRKLNYVGEVFEPWGQDEVEHIFVITPEGRGLLWNSSLNM